MNSYSIVLKNKCIVNFVIKISLYIVIINILFLSINTYAGSNNKISISNLNIQAVADKITVDNKTKSIYLEGNVEIIYNQIKIICNKLTLYLEKEELIAEGEVIVYEADKFLMQTKKFKSNFSFTQSEIFDVTLRLPGNIKLFSYKWTKKTKSLEQLEKAIFTTCATCEDKAPLWQFNSERVVWDKESKRIHLYNSIFKFFNFPIMYMPYINIPGPNINRASGFLIPQTKVSSMLGFFVETPVYWAIDNSSDVTFKPIISFTEYPGLDIEYRKKLKHTGIETKFILQPKVKNKNYSSDLLFYVDNAINIDFPYNIKLKAFNSYSYKLGYHPRFNLSKISDTLKNEINVSQLRQQTWLDIYINRYDQLKPDNKDSLFSYSLPSILFENWIDLPNGFGDLSLNIENTYQFNKNNTSQLRLTAETEYRNELTGLGGIVWENTINLRGDVYYTKRKETKAFTFKDWRFLPELSSNISYGLMKIFSASPLSKQPFVGVFEPFISINYLPAIYSKGWEEANVINQDSLSINQHLYRFYSTNRSSGYDKVETGLRIDYGASVKVHYENYRMLLSIGQSYRPLEDEYLFKETGIQKGFSRIILRSELASPQFSTNLTLGLNANRVDISKKDLIYFTSWNASVNFPYVRLDTNLLYKKADKALSRKQLWNVELGVNILLTTEWSLAAKSYLDLLRDFSLTKGSITLKYDNPCFFLSVEGYQGFNNNGFLSDSFGFNFNSGLVLP